MAYKTPSPTNKATSPPQPYPTTDPTPPFHVPLNTLKRGTNSAARADIAEVLARVGDESIQIDEIARDLFDDAKEFKSAADKKLSMMLSLLNSREALKEGRKLRASIQSILGDIKTLQDKFHALSLDAENGLDLKITKVQKNKRYSGELKAKYEGVKDYY